MPPREPKQSVCQLATDRNLKDLYENIVRSVFIAMFQSISVQFMTDYVSISVYRTCTLESLDFGSVHFQSSNVELRFYDTKLLLYPEGRN